MAMRVQKEISETVCFTGHRHLSMTERQLEEKVADLIMRAIKQGYTHFISGGAVGFDTIAAEQVIMIKDLANNGITAPITLEIAVPCENQTRGWSKRQRQRYEYILAQADIVNEAKVPYSPHAMHMRNKYMVIKSALVITYFTGKNGGTKNTLEFAENQGCEIWRIE